MKAKKVKVEIVGHDGWFKKFLKKAKKVLGRIKLGIAIFLDLIDLFIGWIPIVNTAWDVVCFLILLLILKHKKLAYLSLIELPFIGLPPFSIIDMFIPVCSIVVLLDRSEFRFVMQ